MSIKVYTFPGLPEILDFQLWRPSGSLETSLNHSETLDNAPGFPQLRLRVGGACCGRPSQLQGHKEPCSGWRR